MNKIFNLLFSTAIIIGLNQFALFGQDILIKVISGTTKKNEITLTSKHPIQKVRQGDQISGQNFVANFSLGNSKFKFSCVNCNLSYKEIVDMLPKGQSVSYYSKNKSNTFSKLTKSQFDTEIGKQHGIAQRGDDDKLSPSIEDNAILLSDSVELFLFPSNESSFMDDFQIIENQLTTPKGEVLEMPHDKKYRISHVEIGEYKWSYTYEDFYGSEYTVSIFFVVPDAENREIYLKEFNDYIQQTKEYDIELQPVLINEYLEQTKFVGIKIPDFEDRDR